MARYTLTREASLGMHGWLCAILLLGMQHQLHPFVSNSDASATSESFSTTGTFQCKAMDQLTPTNHCKLQSVSKHTLAVWNPSKGHAPKSYQNQQDEQEPGHVKHLAGHGSGDRFHLGRFQAWVASIKHPPLSSNTQSREHRVHEIRNATWAKRMSDFAGMIL